MRARTSKPSKGICSAVFGMDIERDIAYPYTSRFGKGNGKILPLARTGAGCVLHVFIMPNSIYALILAGARSVFAGEPAARPKQLLAWWRSRSSSSKRSAMEGLVPPDVLDFDERRSEEVGEAGRRFRRKLVAELEARTAAAVRTGRLGCGARSFGNDECFAGCSFHRNRAAFRSFEDRAVAPRKRGRWDIA